MPAYVFLVMKNVELALDLIATNVRDAMKVKYQCMVYVSVAILPVKHVIALGQMVVIVAMPIPLRWLTDIAYVKKERCVSHGPLHVLTDAHSVIPPTITARSVPTTQPSKADRPWGSVKTSPMKDGVDLTSQTPVIYQQSTRI